MSSLLPKGGHQLLSATGSPDEVEQSSRVAEEGGVLGSFKHYSWKQSANTGLCEGRREVGGRGRDRERDRDRQTERERERERDRQTDRERKGNRERQREGESNSSDYFWSILSIYNIKSILTISHVVVDHYTFPTDSIVTSITSPSTHMHVLYLESIQLPSLLFEVSNMVQLPIGPCLIL